MKTLSLCLTALLLSFLCASAADTHLKIIHMNDTHSYLEPVMTQTHDAGGEKQTAIGGMDIAAGLISELRKSSPDSMVLHAGDMIQGTMYFSLFNGQPDAEVLRLIGFDAVAIGNHDFDRGDDLLAMMIDSVGAPFISSNVVPRAGNILKIRVRPYTIKTIGTERYGIIGVTTAQKTKNSSNPSSMIDFRDETKSTQNYIDALKAKGIEKIIVLSHIGYEEDLRLAASLTGVDVIVGGDSHSLLGDFSYLGLVSDGAYPSTAVNRDGDKVCVVQAWSFGRAVGELDVTFNGSRVADCNGATHLVLESSAVPDANVTAVIKTFRDQIETVKQTETGQVSADILHSRVPEHPEEGVTLPLGSDAVPAVARAFYIMNRTADLVLLNAGSVRGSIPKGPMSIGSIYSLMPYGNTLYETQAAGSDIRAALEGSLDYIAEQNSDGAFPYGYGIRYDIDASKPSGERFFNIEIKDRETGEWKPLEPERKYKTVTISYLISGKNGYERLAGSDKGVNTYTTDADTFINFMNLLTKHERQLTPVLREDHPVKSYISTPDESDKL